MPRWDKAMDLTKVYTLRDKEDLPKLKDKDMVGAMDKF